MQIYRYCKQLATQTDIQTNNCPMNTRGFAPPPGPPRLAAAWFGVAGFHLLQSTLAPKAGASPLELRKSGGVPVEFSDDLPSAS